MKKNIILITGVTGFVGSHLFNRLRQDGQTVYGISRSKESKNIFSLDIEDIADFKNFVKQKKNYTDNPFSRFFISGRRPEEPACNI